MSAGAFRAVAGILLWEVGVALAFVYGGIATGVVAVLASLTITVALVHVAERMDW